MSTTGDDLGKHKSTGVYGQGIYYVQHHSIQKALHETIRSREVGREGAIAEVPTVLPQGVVQTRWKLWVFVQR